MILGEGQTVTDEMKELKSLIDGTLDVVLRTQTLVQELMDRVVKLEVQQAQLEKELQPQLISLTQLITELTGRRDN